MGTRRTDASELAREHTESAIQVLSEVMNDWLAETKDRIKAAEALLDRGHGKAAQAVIAVPMTRQQQMQLAGMSDADLIAHIQAVPLPRLVDQRVRDADFEIVTQPAEPDIDPLLR